MAPEHPPELVIFDSRFEDGKLRGDLQYVEAPVGRRLRVRWDVERKPESYRSIGGGVAYVFSSKQLKVFPVSRDATADDLGNFRYRWSEGLNFGVPWLMFILILPKGYTLIDPKPSPARAKLFRKRIALYWIPKGDDIGRTNVECTLKAFEGAATSKLVELNRVCAGRNPPPIVLFRSKTNRPSKAQRPKAGLDELCA